VNPAIQPMALADVPANLRPNDLTILLLLFLAFLRRYGFLPPTQNPGDDEFTSLGLDGGFAKAHADAAAAIMARPNTDPATKSALLYSLALHATAYRSGSVKIG
jgi:hypothetical protein